MGGASKYRLGPTNVCQALLSEGWAGVEKEGKQDSGSPSTPSWAGTSLESAPKF